MAEVTPSTDAELRERIKELKCLYGVVRLAAERGDEPLGTILKGIVEIIPPAWKYPKSAEACIYLDGEEYATSGYDGTGACQSADIALEGEIRGKIEVTYRGEHPAAAEGPFLDEERNLIDTIAAEISGIVERHTARAERRKLEEQVRHADRLATIGQLAAGVAHELNEPLGNILGFAELASGVEGVPHSVMSDLSKIVKAGIHAREIVNKLRLFARQMPACCEPICLNDVVDEGMYFIESRCAKQGIRIMRKLQRNLPYIEGDPGQMHQVLTNLTVNAVQAMPDGGMMTVGTRSNKGEVILWVEDQGVGISEEVKRKIFMPFFSTKDVDQGTGLGLSVVEGIVTTHRGAIDVRSRPGEGTRFEVRFPRMDGGEDSP